MEILQDTIIKLIIRQGSDTDRKAIVLTSGEQGYTTDSKRVFVGDGVELGGHVVGNLVKPEFTGSPGVPPNSSVVGDLAFNSTTRKLYKSNVAGSITLTDWLQVGGVYSSGDSYIKISADNTITLAPLSGSILDPSLVQYPITLSGGKISLPPLSAGTVSSDLLRSPITLSGGKISLAPLSSGSMHPSAVGFPIIIDGFGKITLDPLPPSYISTDAVAEPIFIDAFGRVALNPLPPTFISSAAVASPLYIDGSGKVALSALSATITSNAVEAPIIINNGKIALSANIPFQIVSTNTLTVSSGLSAFVNGVNVTNQPVNPLSASILIQAAPIGTVLESAAATLFDGPIVFTGGKISLSASIPFQRVSTNTITASSGLASYVNGVYMDSQPINPLSANIVIQSTQLLINFDGATGTTLYTRGISGIRIGLGTYLFRFGPLPTANIYPFVQLAGITNHKWTSRIMSTSVSSLCVYCYDQTAGAPNQPGDLPLYLQINY